MMVIKNIVNVAMFLLLNISVFFIICHIGISYTFGKVTLEQILFHLNVPSVAVDRMIVTILSLFGLLYIVFLVIHTSVFRNVIYNNLNGSVKNDSIYNIICISISLTTIFYLVKKYDIHRFYNAEVSTFIEENYNDCKVSFNEKRNLVLIFLESIESGYTNASALGKNLIQELEELSINNVSFSGYIQTHGSGWTQASLVNMLLGIPLMWPDGLCFNKRSQRSIVNEFLPHAASLTRTLYNNGYSTNIFLGSSTVFSDKNKLFATHKIENVYDKPFFDKNGYDTNENYGITYWGYKDDFIYKKAFDEYKQLSSSNKPFFLMVETVDTHFPNGYVEQDQVEFGDIRDSIRQSSIMCSNFVKKLYEYNNLHNTTVVIVGDHLWIMNPLAKFTEKMENIKSREIYNVFINSAISNKQIQTKRCYAPFDMAPTILEAIGANLHKNRFGLGTSLFSKEKTLLEKYGVQYVNEELAKRSPFYLNLF